MLLSLGKDLFMPRRLLFLAWSRFRHVLFVDILDASSLATNALGKWVIGAKECSI